MKEKEISDDEIQILGLEYKKQKATKPFRKNWRWAAVFLTAIIIVVALGYLIFQNIKTRQTIEPKPVAVQLDIEPEEPAATGYIEVSDETINDVPLRIYTPRNAIPELTLSLPDENDSLVVFVTRAADIGGNDYGIVGDFVLKGEKLARGVRKEGFCAIINQTLTIGVNTETPLLQDAIQEQGYFFRQYPLVSHSEAIDNRPKGKSIRRALAIRRGDIIMVESLARESFHDFAQALADAGVSEAIYLCGGSDTYGWYREEQGKQTFFGTKKENYLEGENFLVWKHK
jgi:hypothetical protein